MNKKEIFEIAKRERPEVKIIKKIDWFRHDIVKELVDQKNIGIELGTAKGIYSKRMLESSKFKKFYAVDSYLDTYTDQDYINTLKFLEFKSSNFCLIRSDFDSALNLFEDNYFDFIYIDGYAHTGEEGGKTIIEWYKKLKPGGILAGDDYHDDWPLVIWAVNNLVKQLNISLNVTGKLENKNYSKYPTWYIKKPTNNVNVKINQKLFSVAMKEKDRINKKRTGTIGKIKRFLSNILQIFRVIR